MSVPIDRRTWATYYNGELQTICRPALPKLFLSSNGNAVFRTLTVQKRDKHAKIAKMSNIFAPRQFRRCAQSEPNHRHYDDEFVPFLHQPNFF